MKPMHLVIEQSRKIIVLANVRRRERRNQRQGFARLLVQRGGGAHDAERGRKVCFYEAT